MSASAMRRTRSGPAISPKSTSPSTPTTGPRPKMGGGVAKPVVLVAACVFVDAQGRVLITKRPEGKPLAGLWEFPGGKVEPDETPEQALIRELDEELGVRVSAPGLTPLTFASHT